MIDAAFILLIAIFVGLEIRSRRSGAQEKLREDRQRRLQSLAHLDGLLGVALKTARFDARGGITVLLRQEFRN